MKSAGLIACFFTILAAAALGVTQTAPSASVPATRAEDQHPTVIVVIGAEGEPEFGSVFIKSADRWADAAHRASANLIVIGRDPPPDAATNPSTLPAAASASQPSTTSAASAGPTEKQQFQQALESLDRNSTQPLWLVFIGHGTFDGREAKVNLRGPDFSDIELAQWLKPFTRPMAIIDCTASSAPFLNRLSARGRVIITATRSGAEVNYARFGDYLSAAIAHPAADLDKDGQTSLLEAFLAASHGVADFYKSEGRLATEHALIDDNGDGLGTPADWFQGTRAVRTARNDAAPDGARANQWALVQSPAELALPPDIRARRDQLELQIESLRGMKSSLSENDYYTQLDALLMTLARIYPPPATNPQIPASNTPATSTAPASPK